MSNYATVCWTADDVIQNAHELDMVISRAKAEEILVSQEIKIMDAMVESGWQVIEEALLPSR